MDCGGLFLSAWVVSGVVLAALCPKAAGGPGDGIHLGPFVLQPSLDAIARYDSNVELTATNEQDDAFYQLRAGADLDCKTRTVILDASAFVLARRYWQIDDRDFESAGQSIQTAVGNADVLLVKLTQGYRRIEDVEDYGLTDSADSVVALPAQSSVHSQDRAFRTRRDLSDVGIQGLRDLTDDLDLLIGYDYRGEDYEIEEFYDNERHEGRVESSLQLTDKTRGMLELRYGEEGNDSFPENAKFWSGRLGFKLQGTDKVTFSGKFGIEHYDRTDEEALNDTEQGIFSFDVESRWDATDKLTIHISGRNGFRSAVQYENMVDQFTVGSIGAAYSMTEATTVGLSASYRKDEYQEPLFADDLQIDRKDDSFSGVLRAHHEVPGSFLAYYADITYRTVNSTIPGQEYDQFWLGLGATLRY